MSIARFSVNQVVLVNLRFLVLMLLPVALGACSQAAPAPTLRIWAADDIHGPAVGPPAAGDPGPFDTRAARMTLTGAIGETLGFPVFLSAATHAFPDVDLTATDLQSGASRVPGSAVQVYRVHNVHVDQWPGWHIRLIEPARRAPEIPDVLVPASAPRGGLPFTLERGDTAVLWIDLTIPKGTAPGVYEGQLVARSGGETAGSLNLSVQVLPFLLPDVTDVTLLCALDHRSLIAHHVRYQDRPYAPDRIFADNPMHAEVEAVVRSAMRLLQSHHLSPTLPFLYPVVKIDADQNVTVQWDDYDRVVAANLDGTAFADRRGLALWPLPFDEHFPPPPSYGAADSPAHARLVSRYLAECARHFKERTWLDRAYVTLPFASDPTAEAFSAVLHFGGVIREAVPDVRRVCRLAPQNLGLYGWQGYPYREVSSCVDIWCPPAQFFDPPVTESAWPADGSESWYRLDSPPFSGSIEVSAPPTYTRVIPWQAFRLGAEVVALGIVNDASTEGPEWTPQQCTDRNPGVLLYPGTPFGLHEPVPSVRLKRLRRGMQDLAYFDLLRRRGLSHVATLIAESMSPFAAAGAYGAHFADGRTGGWVEDAQWWGIARQVMADELIRNIPGSVPDAKDEAAATLRWRNLMAATRNVTIEVNGVRVRPAGPSPQDGATIEAHVMISNHARIPLAGFVSYGELPLGWVAQPDRIEIPELPPGAAHHVTVVAHAEVIAWDSDGVRYLPIVFETADRGTFRVSARMGYVPAHPLGRPLAVDGDLADWPPAPGNLAGDFVPITGESNAAGEAPGARPASPTRCFVARDSEALYFGFDCASVDSASLVAGSNLVEYEDMIPVGEDLVELLLDPEAAGTRSTGDLYHVVIKRSGATWERGIGTNPPTGRHGLWAADIQHATRWHGDHWEAEIRIPLSAFDASVRGNRIWGINFTRFDAAHQEYANWSGAVSNVYDPLALGNLGL